MLCIVLHIEAYNVNVLSSYSCWYACTGALIPIMSPNIYEGDVHGNAPPNILEVASFILILSSNNCCLLYFNANIMCSFTKKLQLLGESPRRPTPGPHWGTSIRQTPSLRLCPPIILWDRRPWPYTCCHIPIWQVQRHADILATILARMSARKSVSVSVSVSAPWNASLWLGDCEPKSKPAQAPAL